MRINVYLADQNPHRDRTLGVTNMTQGLLEELAQREQVELNCLYSISSFQFPTRHGLRLKWRTDRAIQRLLTDQLHTCFWRTPADVQLYPKGHLPLFFRSSIPTVGIVHDTILLWYRDHYPQDRSWLAYQYWLTVLRRSIARFDLILTISNHAKQQILDLCDRFRVKPPPIKVVYESIRFADHRATTTKENYLLHLASQAPHKKTLWLLENWRELRAAGQISLRLKLVGKIPVAAQSLIQDDPSIDLLPFQSETNLANLISAARAVIVPSEIEGFGLPALESYCLGTPSVYVTGTAIDEVLGLDGLGAFELSSSDSFARAVDEVLACDPETIRKTATRLGSCYSKEKLGERVLSALQELKGDGGHFI